MDKNCAHENIYYCGKREYYLFTWSFPNISSISTLNIYSVEYKMKNGWTYSGYLHGSGDKITFYIISTSSRLKCNVSMFIGSETLLLTKSLNGPTSTIGAVRNNLDSLHSLNSQHYTPTKYHYRLITLASGDESFEKLKQHPNDTSVLICRIMYLESSNYASRSVKTPNTSMNSLYNLQMFVTAMKNSSVALLKEKVSLCIGEETESVSKAVICARSSVFAKMFENDMKEQQENVVTITDIKMPVLKVLISYMYTGKLSIGESNVETNCSIDFICDLYYAANKYDISELRQYCMHLLLPQISMENLNQIMKLAFTHNDEVLKSTVLASIAANLETWLSTDDWRNLIDNEPDIAEKVINFLDF